MTHIRMLASVSLALFLICVTVYPSSAAADDWCKTSNHTSMEFSSTSGDRVQVHLERTGDHVTGSMILLQANGQVVDHGFLAGDFGSRPYPDLGPRWLELKMHFTSGLGDVIIEALLSNGSGQAS